MVFFPSSLSKASHKPCHPLHKDAAKLRIETFNGLIRLGYYLIYNAVLSSGAFSFIPSPKVGVNFQVA